MVSGKMNSILMLLELLKLIPGVNLSLALKAAGEEIVILPAGPVKPQLVQQKAILQLRRSPSVKILRWDIVSTGQIAMR